MTTLRLLLDAPGAADAPAAWALFDASGACVSTGCDPSPRWPQADVLEVVVAASRVRLASVALPPVPAARVAAAAAFALEDQLAGPADEHWLAASTQQAGGRVVVVIVARALLAGWRARAAGAGRTARLTRILAEPELAPAGTGLCWCIPADADAGSGFVRLPDGSAFPVDAAPADGSLPPELTLALARAASGGTMPAQVRVDGAVSDAALLRWRQETGVAFVRGKPWQWYAADPAAFASATNLLQGEMAPTPPPRRGARLRLFAPAAWIAAAALVLHVTATLGDWAWWRIDAWRAARAWTAIATAAGVPAAAAATPAAARSALAQRYAEARHAHGLPAPHDALPLLARAAPAFAALPAGTLRSATYADGHWTLDLQRADPGLIRDLDGRLKRAGTPAIIATTPAGTRLRIGVP
jgi:type II secretion system protein L